MCDQGGDLPGVTSLVTCDSLCTGAEITESELCSPHCGLFDYHLLGVAKPAQEEKQLFINYLYGSSKPSGHAEKQ